MWVILETKSAAKHVDRLPNHILEKYEFWRNIVKVSGPEGLRKFPGFKDHLLKGEWKGHRSSYLNDSYRVIYRIDAQSITVFVINVTHHDYRRK